ncbi:hypothetical protein TW95_gp1004 [Pandoravirus inopinatum]|uniref:Uncharacterized protein n=1 Tax=Pandoravirus inopinatum TaxID=1605721 RepID=A0A0B5IY43_9VIRU|nr:hypothetical protein TW95_gp1004 [Pandoravirus inopinatum]AJF97738.1 hypothetical protein [Pandoravirus inopinatum]
MSTRRVRPLPSHPKVCPTNCAFFIFIFFASFVSDPFGDGLPFVRARATDANGTAVDGSAMAVRFGALVEIKSDGSVARTLRLDTGNLFFAIALLPFCPDGVHWRACRY